MSASVQRRALEEELRLVLEQKATIEAQLAAFRSGGRPAALKSLKRNSSVMPAKTHVPATKKQKVEDRQKRLQSLWGQMNTLLKQICKQRDAAHFQSPVDAEKLKVPDYYKIIKKPMDLGTVKNKLEDKPERGQPRAYKDPYELLSDVRQVWANCRAYNPEGHPVRQMGDRLSDAWEKKWHASGIEGKWEDIVREQKADELGPAIVPHRCKEMGAELRELSQLAAPAPGFEPSGPRDFMFEDKRRLSQQLGSLPGERLLRVLEIVAKSSAPPVNEDGEAEVDIDALDNATLLELEDYVNSVLDVRFCMHNEPSPVDLARKTDSMKAAPAKQSQPAKTQPDQETTSRPLDGAAAPPGNDEAPAPGAIAEKSPAGAAQDAAAQRDSASRSSASSDSSKSSDGSMGEVGSKHESGDGGNAKRAETAADQSTLVSATHPQQAPPIYQPKSRKDVTLQNEGAWGALAAAQPSAAKDVAKPADGSAGAAGSGPNSSAPGEQDPLWSEFASREQQQRKREAEKAAEEEKRRAEKAKAEEAVRKQAEERRRAAEAEAEAERAKAAESRARADAELEEQRQREMQALQTDAMDLAGPQDTGRFEGGGGNALAALGLVSKPEDDDDDSDSDSDDNDGGQDADMEDAEKEEGEA